MWDMIKQINMAGITIVMTTHYMEEAEYLCSRVAIMDQGKILRLDPPQKLISELAKTSKLSFFASKPSDPNFFADQNFFKALAGVEKVQIDPPKVTLDLTDVECLPKIIQSMKNAGIGYSFLNLKSGTLEDVYLQLTGHEYEL